MDNKILIMLIGLPATGKSTWVENKLKDYSDEKFIYISSDKHIDEYASMMNLTYNDVFDEYIGIATKLLNDDVDNAIKNGDNVIWDQTNLSKKTRSKKLDKFENYIKIAIVFELPDKTEHKRRLESRVGKIISNRVIYSMKNNFEYPTIDEGFDYILTIGNN